MNKFQRDFVSKAKEMGVDVVGLEEGGKHTKLVYRTAEGITHRFPMARMATTCSMKNALSSLRRSSGVAPREHQVRTLPTTIMGVPVKVETVAPSVPEESLASYIRSAEQPAATPKSPECSMPESNGHADSQPALKSRLGLADYLALQKFVSENWGVITTEKPTMDKFIKEAMQALGLKITKRHMHKLLQADGREWPSVKAIALKSQRDLAKVIGAGLVLLYEKLGEEMPDDLRKLAKGWRRQ